MKPWLFRCHVTMLGRLQAEEALTQISTAAAGSGCMEESDQRQYLRDLRMAANGGRQPRAMKANAASLAAIGIAVKTE